MTKLFNKLSYLTLLLKNAGWLLSLEVIAKISRLATIIALAANLSATEYGTAMLALSVHEVMRMMLRSGAGSQVIQCKDSDLASVAHNANYLQWFFCLSLAACQILLAPYIGQFYNNSIISDLLILMATVYAIYPIVSIKVFLLQRQNRMKEYSLRNGLCIVVENLSIALFALLGSGMLAVVIGKWLFVACWVLCFFNIRVPHILGKFEPTRLLELVRTSAQLVVTEFSRAMRFHLDTLIAGRLLTPDLFGLYCFARSAGVGITQSLSNAFTSALYPYVCNELRAKTSRMTLSTSYIMALVVGLAFVIQAVAVPVYVPILFGAKWDLAQTTTAILCLAGLPAVLMDTLCVNQRARGEFYKELTVRCYCLFASTLMLVLTAPVTPEGVAFTMLASTLFWLLCFLPELFRKSIARVINNPLPTPDKIRRQP